MHRLAGTDDGTLRAYGAHAAARCAQEDDRSGALDRVCELLEACVDEGGAAVRSIAN